MNLKKELPIIAIVLLPFIYLAYIWNEIPSEVPMHWNIKGEIDRYGSKTELIFVIIMLPVLVYVLFTVIPIIDPKNKFGKMGNKFTSLKFLFTLIMSILSIFIINAAYTSTANMNILLMIIGSIFMILGNYFKTIRSNYFIGIRTPWTLENETVWKKTHKLGGQLFFFGGLLIVMLCLLTSLMNMTIFLIITAIVSIVPIVYSYLIYPKK